ncbi:MAG: hypothetical protein ACON49_09065 [Candidatus Puniceispirillaceae bacterium]
MKMIFAALGLFFGLVGLPMFVMSRDMWDGTVIEYASEIQNFIGLKAWFFEASWFSQYYLSLTVITAAEMCGISYKAMNTVFVLIFMFVLLRETALFARDKLKFSQAATHYAVFLVASFSVWHVLFSSVMLMHLGCLTFGMVCVRLTHQTQTGKKVIGFIGLFVVFTLNSMLVFLPALSYLYDLVTEKDGKGSWIKKPGKQTMVIFMAGLLFYSMVRNFFAPHAMYENYNNLIIFNKGGMFAFAKLGLQNVTFLYPLTVVVIFIAVVTFMSDMRKAPHNLLRIIPSPKRLSWLIGLFVAGFLPYIAVGKAEMLLRVYDWDSRQALVLAVPAALITAYYVQFLFEHALNRYVKNCVLIGAAAIIIFQTGLLAKASLYKLNRQVFVAQLEEAIGNHSSMPAPGLLEIVGEGIPYPEFRGYESNFLMYKATGKADWWSRLARVEKKSFAIPCFIQQHERYQKNYVYNFEQQHLKNHTVMTIKADGFIGFLPTLLNSFGIGRGGTVNIEKVEARAEKSPDALADCNK